MGRYMINGTSLVDDKSIEHGLGIGSGRGRPKGSRNGYISPGAAYMKDYEIKGEVAQPILGAGDGIGRNSVANRTAKPTSAPKISVQNGRSNGGGYARKQANTVVGAPKNATVDKNVADINLGNNEGAAADSFKLVGGSSPAAKVQNGKTLFDQLVGGVQEKSGNVTSAVKNTMNNFPSEALKESSYNSRQNVYPEQKLTEQVIPEEKIEEQYLQEQKPNATKMDEAIDSYLEKHPEYQSRTANYQPPELNLKKPDPLADAWNGLLDWGKNAWKGISDAATSAIDTGKGWAKDGLDWLNTNVLDPASKWGSQAVSDVSNWIGDRGRDLDRWWNGYDSGNAPAVQDRRHGVANDQYVQSHVNGFRENAGNAINGAVRSVGNFVNGAARDAGQWIGDRAEDADRWWNGYDSGNAPAVQDRRHGVANDQYVQQHVNGFRENAANAINGAVRDAGNAVNSAARSAGEFATRAANDVGQFVSDRAQDAVDLAGTTIQKVVDAAGDIKDAVVDGYGRVIGFLDTNVGQPVDRFLNGTTTYSGEYNPETGESVTTETHAPGFLENAGSFISSLPGQAQAAAGEAIRTITDAYGRAREAVVDTYGNFVRWADNAVQDARIGASGVVNQESNTFGGMTNSILAQNARAAGLSPARLARLADAYGPNNVANFESVLFDYANGRLSDEQIDEIIRNR